jgi:hypothetical protein
MLLESEVALDLEAIRDGKYRILKRAGVVASHRGEFRAGDDFRGTVEVRPDVFDEKMEVVVDVEMGKEGEVVDAVKSSMLVENGGLPAIISQSKGDEGWRALVVRAWGRWGDREWGE